MDNTPARRSRAVSFTAQIIRDDGSDDAGQAANATQVALGSQSSVQAGEVASQADQQSVAADPRTTIFNERVDVLVTVLGHFQADPAPNAESCANALNEVTTVLEEVNAEYNAHPARCPLVNYREEHLVGQLSRHLGESLMAHAYEILLWTWVVQGAPNVTIEMRVAAAKLCLITLEINEDVAHEIARSGDFSMEELLHEVAVSSRSTLRAYLTGILGVLMTDHKSHETADLCVMPFETDDPLNPTKKTRVSLPREISKRLRDELLPLLDRGSLSLAEQTEVRLTLRCLSFMGEYNEALEPVLEYDVVGILLRVIDNAESTEDTLYEALEACSRLLAHKVFAERFVRNDGIDIILGVAKRATRPPYLNPSIGWCLSGISFLTSVLEQVVRLGGDTVKRLVAFELSLLRSEQDLARKNGLSFFAHAFAFPAILAQFDNCDGCRTLLDLVRRPNCSLRSIPILNLVKHTTRTLRDYFRAHVAQVAYFLRNVFPKNASKGTRAKKIPLNKPLPLDPAGHAKDMETLQSRAKEVVTFLTQTKWRPVEELLQYRSDEASSGVSLLLGLVKFCEHEMGHNAEETSTATLQVLAIASLLPIIHGEICSQPAKLNRSYLRARKSSTIEAAANGSHTGDSGNSGAHASVGNEGEDDDDEEDMDEDEEGFAFGTSETGISVLLSVAGTIGQADDSNPKGILAALQTLSNCVSSDWSGEDAIHKQSRALSRNNNGVMILLALLNYKESPGDADPIRFYACNALFGISHEVEVADILKALDVDRLLSDIANSDPVVAEMTGVHQRLRQKALDLLNIISPGGEHEDIALAADAAARKIQRDGIVRRSNVQWDQRDLMRIIWEHLDRHGCVNAARALFAEAGLARGGAPEQPSHPSSAVAWPSRPRLARRRPRVLMRRKMLKPRFIRRQHPGAPAPVRRLASVTPSRSTSASQSRPHRDSLKDTPVHMEGEESTMPAMSGATTQRRRHRHPSERGEDDDVKRTRLVETQPSQLSQPQSQSQSTTVEAVVPATLGPSANPTLLERIVREHLLHQHQMCRNPVTTPPPFALLDQVRDPSRNRHTCPDVVPKSAPLNLAKRVMERSLHPPWGGHRGRQLMNKTLYSKAKFSRQYNYGLSSQDLRFTTVAFRKLLGSNDQMLFGTEAGVVHRYGVWNAGYLGTWDLTTHLDGDESFAEEEDFSLSGLEMSPSSPMFLTSVKRGKSAIVWRVLDEEDVAVAFKLKDARGAILDASGATVAAFVRNATVVPGQTGTGVALYSLESGGEQPMLFLPSEGYISNNYSHTNLCMTSGGALVCYDGVLWDARRTNRPIHKFDKLSDFGWGGLHPNGLQLLLDKDMWDLRTFRIVQSCSNALHASSFRFDPSGDVIYSWHDSLRRANNSSNEDISTFSKSVVVTDATDYTSIASWNVDRAVYDLNVHPNGGSVGLVVQTNAGSFEAEGRMYEVGRTTPDEADVDIDEFAVAAAYPHSETDDEEEGDDGFDDDDDEIGSGDEIVLEGDNNAIGEAFLRVISAMNQHHRGAGENADWAEGEEDGEEEDGEDDEEIDFGDEDEDEEDGELDDDFE